MIIIEGADDLGKTTACETLARLFDWSVVHHGPPTMSPAIEYSRKVLHRCAVHDRGHLGWLVWQGLLGCNGHPYEATTMEALVNSLRRRRALVVVMHADPTWYQMRLDARMDREELYHYEIRLVANRAFRYLTRSRTPMGDRYCDLSWDVGAQGFPTDEDFERWVGRWRVRQAEAL